MPTSPVTPAGDPPPAPPRPARRRHRSPCPHWRSCARKGRLRGLVALLGPAFVAAVAYVDPGNFATNIAAGARHGYALAWVVVMANAMAMLVQYLSAKAGIATGMDLPELCRTHFRRPVSRGLWVQAEIVAMATDLAEFVGAAIGLQPAVRGAAVPGRADHRGGRVRRAGAGAARLPPVRAGDRRAARPGAARLRLRPARGRAEPGELARAGAELRRRAAACCSPPASSAPRSCRTWSTCTRR